MGRPIGAQNKEKPFRDALRIEAQALANGEMIEHPPGSLRSLAQALLLKGASGDVAGIKETADRLDGKVAQPMAGEDGEGPMKVVHEVSWKPVSLSDDPLSSTMPPEANS